MNDPLQGGNTALRGHGPKAFTLTIAAMAARGCLA